MYVSPNVTYVKFIFYNLYNMCNKHSYLGDPIKETQRNNKSYDKMKQNAYFLQQSTTETSILFKTSNSGQLTSQ